MDVRCIPVTEPNITRKGVFHTGTAPRLGIVRLNPPLFRFSSRAWFLWSRYALGKVDEEAYSCSLEEVALTCLRQICGRRVRKLGNVPVAMTQSLFLQLTFVLFARLRVLQAGFGHVSSRFKKQEVVDKHIRMCCTLTLTLDSESM